MPRFFINSKLEIAQTISLPRDLVRHIKVLRLRINTQIELFNGNSNCYLALIEEIDKNSIKVKISQLIENKMANNSKITVAIGLIDKMDIVVAKLTELGVNTIIPILCERSQNMPQDRLLKKFDHWRKIIIASCMQCGQNTLPKLSSVIKFNEIFNLQLPSTKIIFSLEDGHITQNNDVDDLFLLVGPEGGFTTDEYYQALNNNFVAIKLGSLVLRAETAAIAVTSWAKTFFNKW